MTQKDARLRALRRQIERLDGRLTLLNQASDRLVRWRLVLFLAAVGVSVLTLWQWGALAWAGATAVALLPFIWSVRAHRLVENGRSRYTLWRQIKQTHVARMTLDWANIPAASPLPPRLDHPFALDLDLIGDHSLLQLLDTAVSHDGSHRLQTWLLDTEPQLATIQSRQPLVGELAAMPRFRDKLALHATLAADDTAEKWPIQRLLDWLKAGDEGASLRPTLWLLGGLALLNLTLLGLNLAGLLPALWPVSWLLYGLVFVSRMQAVAPLFNDAYFLETSLRRLGEVFGFLEGYRYGERARVRQLCAPFLDPAERPSRHLRAATLVLTMAGLRQNPFLWLLLNGFVPWDFVAAYLLERRRAALRQRLPGWLDCWFELEALNSLATFAYLNPDAPFPTLTTEKDAPPLRGTAVGHPLIPDAVRVCNDFRIANIGELALVTGSNMAGKSSFLRALGVNLVLANCGGPVVADVFEARLCRLYTSIRVADSVTDGFSYFYAEVRRLQGLLAALGEGDERPLFFLIDEIFRGTNNRERLIGSRSFARALVGGHGVGLIATHDLELVKLADESAAIRNYHFRDDVADGQMTFDYTLRPGPCPTTNALKIMRLAGLPVENA
jgi:hypothetical protein